MKDPFARAEERRNSQMQVWVCLDGVHRRRPVRIGPRSVARVRIQRHHHVCAGQGRRSQGREADKAPHALDAARLVVVSRGAAAKVDWDMECLRVRVLFWSARFRCPLAIVLYCAVLSGSTLA